jgi:hypothetical protein
MSYWMMHCHIHPRFMGWPANIRPQWLRGVLKVQTRGVGIVLDGWPACDQRLSGIIMLTETDVSRQSLVWLVGGAAKMLSVGVWPWHHTT